MRVGYRLDAVRRQQVEAGDRARAAAGDFDERTLLGEQQLRAEPLLEDGDPLQRIRLDVQDVQERVVGEGFRELALVTAAPDLDGERTGMLGDRFDALERPDAPLVPLLDDAIEAPARGALFGAPHGSGARVGHGDVRVADRPGGLLLRRQW
ncbi:hypothetical protein [Streptomyces halobius]|uniref:Uncharacterized protein n=1 Tax=Streptomyces halobius TaxID=2879846 RepID=A0ABY4M2U4_9ACTN|nr:hypothetical protein [Streptomyces halobius]UQA91184.1 hypothetical protein K9S39_04170 [Streptomyces halobius]